MRRASERARERERDKRVSDGEGATGRDHEGRRDETCPISTGGGTRRVHLVRGGVGRDHERELKVAQRAEAHVADVQRGRRRPAVVRARQRQDL